MKDNFFDFLSILGIIFLLIFLVLVYLVDINKIGNNKLYLIFLSLFCCFNIPKEYHNMKKNSLQECKNKYRGYNIRFLFALVILFIFSLIRILI